MLMYDYLTEEEECAVIKGYLAGRVEDAKNPPETYREKPALLACWYWGYYQAKNH